jgi:predicted nuclease of predicted toxin-antitoxin system
MRFLVDAQLPKRFCGWLAKAGHDAVHTLDLSNQNRSTDGEILDIAEREQRIVVTKDNDFVQSYLITGRPARLLLISTGNVSNDELEHLVRAHLATLLNAFEAASYVELGKEFITVHE